MFRLNHISIITYMFRLTEDQASTEEDKFDFDETPAQLDYG